MSQQWTMRPVGYVRSPFRASAEIPKGLGAEHTAEGVLEMLSELEPGLQDIEGFSHLYVIWAFHLSQRSELVGRPPSDDRPHGVFATRSPRRPNPIGLTVVELLGRDGPRLQVRGVDMIDGTPILDLKPVLTTGARPGFHSVTPRIVVTDAAAQIAFLRAAFGATGEQPEGRPAEMRIGDAVILVSQAGARDAFPAFLYLYVDDADAGFARALAAGAVVLEPPLDTPYGDRRAMVRDPLGNLWQIAHCS